ncbi:TAH11 (YJR046W) [Zygosaccharomyces parabailii]|uniref:ZYBA0S09-01530g1_1 n=1 Tax=Zygosaccharomyces bailii (strain CLIB 213 / ATCC 58445 / CBS 680 / BCRC 21525 / NBRC 1098 / NCYC 1416 / NRRL Y-2227) TaxID=1333698 RepID=A0A8J2T9S9_ZYGB2|nr:TAH11 (YJR046W) [Zygosaccharomyces parabailii]CDF90955.1 ZYBA0S09-01530g1_1 [Zygosaccharomyces bailii CLIB 213]CDH09718.1 related to Cell division cycle protein CDT1 [Zygosaccharomyces bailii ISA1307]
MSSSSKIPVLDLNQISDEQELLPVVKSILLNNDTFLLKNYANIDQLDEILRSLDHNDFPDLKQGFDPNFTGAYSLEENLILEQYITNTDDQWQFSRQCLNPSLQNLYSRLWKIGLFFAQLCIKSVVPEGDRCPLSETEYFTKLTRYFHRDDSLQELPNGEAFEYPLSQDFISHMPVGIITVFPKATNIKCKPSTVSSDDNVWISINQPDCLLLHTGSFLAEMSNGIHTTSPLQICPQNSLVHLTIGPSLNTIINSKEGSLAKTLLQQQLEEFPQLALKFYPREAAQLKLRKAIQFYKALFSTCETVLSLYVMSRSLRASVELHSLLPQLSNMMKRKITQDSFLKMSSLWPGCYTIESNSRGELTVAMPKQNPLSMLTNKSRRLEYAEKADAWLQHSLESQTLITDVPAVKLSKRRGSEETTENTAFKQKLTSRATPQDKTSRKYLSNPKEKFMNEEKKTDSQFNLLERLRERERRSAALLSQKQRQYQQFLTVKMKQVFDILYSLPWKRPYTGTYLSGLIVDSLQDSNNPIGFLEAEEILDKLQRLLSQEISVQIVDGGLRVYRWSNLNKDELSAKIEATSREQTNNVVTSL